MTANQAIDGVPRKLRPLLAMILNALDRDATDGKAARGEMASELRALLDAPAKLDLVECDACPTSGGCVSVCMKAPKPSAQPQGEHVGFRYRSNGGPWELMNESPFADGRTHHNEGGEQLEPVYAKKPQGEPVAWQYRIVEDGKPLFNPLKKDGWIDTVEGVAKDMAERPSLSESRHYEVRKLYAEQLAPVAVVLPDRLNHTDGLYSYEYVTGHNAAIDKMLK